MPQIEIVTSIKPGETEADAITKLRYVASRAKERTLARTDAIRTFDSTPAIQTLGDKVILRWHYKQYPFDSGASLDASKEE